MKYPNAHSAVIGDEDRPPTANELDQMKALVRDAMKDGALGVASALIYPPGSFAQTDELIELARVAAEYDGIYISHVRGEGAHLVEAVDELISIARAADVRAEIYHLKASGQAELAALRRGGCPCGAGQGRRSAHHGRRLYLPGGLHRPQRQHAAVGTGGGLRGLPRAACRPDPSAADRRRDDPGVRRVGEHVPRRRLSGQHPAGRLQEPPSSSPDR